MNTKVQKSILAGIIGTAIMTVVMMLAPMMGIPKMSPPKMLSGMLEVPLFVGWVMHFMIGITFGFIYTYFYFFKWKISNIYFKGAVFGVVTFVASQIALAIMGVMFPMPKMEGSILLTMIGSFMGHLIFGMVVAKTVGNAYCNSGSCKAKIA